MFLEIPDYVEITADAKDFELSFTSTVVTPGLLQEMEDDDLDDIRDMIEDIKELADATDELTDGTGEMTDVLQKFYSYLQQYQSGVEALDSAQSQMVLANLMKGSVSFTVAPFK